MLSLYTRKFASNYFVCLTPWGLWYAGHAFRNIRYENKKTLVNISGSNVFNLIQTGLKCTFSKSVWLVDTQYYLYIYIYIYIYIFIYLTLCTPPEYLVRLLRTYVCCTSISERHDHYCDVIMGTMASQFISLTIVYSTVYSGADQREHHYVGNSPVILPVTRQMFPLLTSSCPNSSWSELWLLPNKYQC